jgi:methyl-accepting chemotaxis protein
MAQGVNEMAFGHIAVKKKAMACIAEFGKGNFEAPLEKFPGKKAFINDTIEQVRTNLKALIADANMLVQGRSRRQARHPRRRLQAPGRLPQDRRGRQPHARRGDRPAERRGRLCRPHLQGRHPRPRSPTPTTATSTTIKNNLNQCIDAVDALVADANMLVEAAVAGKLTTRADATKHGGDFRKIVEGVNATLDAVIGPLQDVGQVLEKLAGGDLTAQVVSEYAGDFGQLRTAVNALANQVRTAIQAIGANATTLVSAAEELNKVSQQMSANAEETSAQANVVSAACRTGEQERADRRDRRRGDDRQHSSEIAKNANDAARVATTAVKVGGDHQRHRRRSSEKAAPKSAR